MIGEWRVEQLFVRRAAGRITLLAVLENPAGARRREEVPTPMHEPLAAVRFLARHLARRSDVVGVRRLRVREDRAGEMIDQPTWRDAFIETFDDTYDDADALDA